MSPKGRILCTEDDADTRELLTFILNQAGFDVVCLQGGLDCVTLARSDNFDLFLLDNWMPGMSGVDVCKGIREFDQTTPILFCSGAAHDSDKKAAMAAGAQGYLVKPVAHEELLAEVTRLLN